LIAHTEDGELDGHDELGDGLAHVADEVGLDLESLAVVVPPAGQRRYEDAGDRRTRKKHDEREHQQAHDFADGEHATILHETATPKANVRR
jgi:hypothetical protein